MIKFISRQAQIICLSLLLTSTILPGCKKSKSDPPPVANFNYSGAGMAPATVTFTNASTNGIAYRWDFGDGTIESTEINPSHVYTKGGTYTVKLTTVGNGGSNSVTKTINITSPTSVKITQVKVVQIPFTDSNGGGWDNNSGPDVSFTITDINNNVLYTHSTYYPNVTSGNLPLTFSLSTPFQVTNFGTTYKVLIWDYDGDDAPPSSDEFLGGYSFSFSGFAQDGYPTTATLYQTGSNTKIDLTLQWQ